MNLLVHYHTQHNHFMTLLDFVRDYPGEPCTRKVKPGRSNQSGFTGARDNKWQQHQLGHMHICIPTQTHNHASIPPLIFLQARCPSCCPTNSVKALKGLNNCEIIQQCGKVMDKNVVARFLNSQLSYNVRR